MASDFFERQEVARRNTARLVALFVAAVVAMIAAIDLLLAAVLGYLQRDPATGAIGLGLAANQQVLALATAGTLLVVAGGSLGKIAQLRGGGHVVAEQLAGRLLSADTAAPAERQLLNVVDEMAIASGVPAPPVYVMDGEAGINAFAAGFEPGDAVIGVTRGTLEQLDRDELQGVVAHEFSHILNGDMRMNIRLMGLLHGILIIGMLGYYILRMTAYSGHRARRSRDGGNAMPLLALGAGLLVIGSVGTFFGNLIKAAVSRQREFLADASAVQFTRQPRGLAGALKKIGGFDEGSAVRHPNAPEASHMFFGRATSGLSGLFSTHPPLDERIRRLDPAWDGGTSRRAADTGSAVAAGAAGLAGRTAPAMGSRAAAPPVASVGQFGDAHLQHAHALLERLPGPVLDAARGPYGARALVYALLVDEREPARRRQLEHLSAAADGAVFRETVVLLRLMPLVERHARLPLVDLALPALRRLTRGEHERFTLNVAALVGADDTIDLFEWVLQRVLLHELARARGKAGPSRVTHRRLAAVVPQADVLLSALAWAGQASPPDAARAFAIARAMLGGDGGTLRPADACGPEALDASLDVLGEASPAIKAQVLDAAAACIGVDGRMTVREAELLRATAAALGCPMPPILAAEG
jgi:Zn-dependent protease with chaperone function